MKIGIDISQIVYGGGVSVYTQNLVENLLKIDKENEYLFFFASFRRRKPIFNFKFSNFKIKNFKIPPTLLDLLWNRVHILPIEKFLGKIDIFHSSDWTEPPANCSKVTTIHDLTPLLFPNQVNPKIVAVHNRKLQWVKRECTFIIAVSEATKKDIVKTLKIPEEKIKVIYEACGENFKPQDEAEVNHVKKKYKIKGDYILAFNGPVRKNLDRIKKATADYNLFVIGQPFIDKEDLPALYSGAICLVYASLYEGFGLPIIEAQACGCPVVTSHLSSMPEIAGNAACLVDPLSVESIKKGVERVIKDKNYRKNLIENGFINIKRFDWKKTAKQTLEIYRKACE